MNALSTSGRFPLLKNCSEAGIDRLNEAGEEMLLAGGQRPIQEGSPTDGVHFLLQGKVKVFTSSLLKKEQIVRLATEGNIIGHRGINEEWKFPIGAEALERSRTFFIQLDAFYTVLKEEAAMDNDLMFFFANELMWSERWMKWMTQLRAMQRIAAALLYIHSKFGSGNELFLLPLKRDEIADLAATTQEQVSRTLSEFSRDGKVELQRGAMAIRDLEGLRALRDGDR